MFTIVDRFFWKPFTTWVFKHFFKCPLNSVQFVSSVDGARPLVLPRERLVVVPKHEPPAVLTNLVVVETLVLKTTTQLVLTNLVLDVGELHDVVLAYSTYNARSISETELFLISSQIC